MDELFPVAHGVWRLTVNLDDDDVALFEGLWPVPQGVALHAYLIEGRRRVLVDPWNAGGFGVEELESDLASRGLGWQDIDAVAFTKEPNSVLVDALRSVRSDIAIWGTPSPQARHDLGGATLVEADGFWVAEPAKVVFTGDALAGLGWVEESAWFEELGADAARHAEDESLRWFAGRPLVPVVLPSGARIVAPAHGWLSRDPSAALARARKFAGWAEGDALGEITVVWPAGPDFDAGFDDLIGAALSEGAGLHLFRWPGDDVTAAAAAARRSSLVVVGSGVDEAFLSGLKKDVWRPDVASLDLRGGLVDHWRVP